MSPTERDRKLRELLGVSADATAADILKLVLDTGWTPDAQQAVVDGETAYVCPVHKGIFISVEHHESTGQLAQTGWPTPEIASLEALRKARGLDLISD